MLAQQLQAEPLGHRQPHLQASTSHSELRTHEDSQTRPVKQIVKAELLGPNPGSTVSPHRVVATNTMRQHLLTAIPEECSVMPLAQGNSRHLPKVIRSCSLIFQVSLLHQLPNAAFRLSKRPTKHHVWPHHSHRNIDLKEKCIVNECRLRILLLPCRISHICVLYLGKCSIPSLWRVVIFRLTVPLYLLTTVDLEGHPLPRITLHWKLLSQSQSELFDHEWHVSHSQCHATNSTNLTTLFINPKGNHISIKQLLLVSPLPDSDNFSYTYSMELPSLDILYNQNHLDSAFLRVKGNSL